MKTRAKKNSKIKSKRKSTRDIRLRMWPIVVSCIIDTPQLNPLERKRTIVNRERSLWGGKCKKTSIGQNKKSGRLNKRIGKKIEGQRKNVEVTGKRFYRKEKENGKQKTFQ